MARSALLPAKSFQIDPAPRIELHPFRLEQMPLQFVRVAARSRAYFAARVDDAVPRQAGMRGKGVKCVADQPGMPFQSGELCNLAVGRDAPTRHTPDGGVDALPAGTCVPYRHGLLIQSHSQFPIPHSKFNLSLGGRPLPDARDTGRLN
jgi:hypothetical protein